jgi:hypothetical protein
MSVRERQRSVFRKKSSVNNTFRSAPAVQIDQKLFAFSSGPEKGTRRYLVMSYRQIGNRKRKSLLEKLFLEAPLEANV